VITAMHLNDALEGVGGVDLVLTSSAEISKSGPQA
jgi:hypothetical protein